MDTETLIKQCSFIQIFNDLLLFARYWGYNGTLDNLFIDMVRVIKQRIRIVRLFNRVLTLEFPEYMIFVAKYE